jgi:hypothetical protein
VADKHPTKNKLFFEVVLPITFLNVHLHQYSKIKCQKEVKEKGEIKVFLTFFAY